MQSKWLFYPIGLKYVRFEIWLSIGAPIFWHVFIWFSLWFDFYVFFIILLLHVQSRSVLACNLICGILSFVAILFLLFRAQFVRSYMILTWFCGAIFFVLCSFIFWLEIVIFLLLRYVFVSVSVSVFVQHRLQQRSNTRISYASLSLFPTE